MAVFFVIWLISSGLILYCIMFAIKHDKYSSSIFLLLFLNIFYVPFYLSRMKKIKIENSLKVKNEEIPDKEFISYSRQSIIDVLQFWSSKEEQLIYQETYKDINTTEDLFVQWENFYRIDKKIIKEAFAENERVLIETFDKSISSSMKNLENKYPSIDKFQNSKDWKHLNDIALNITNELK